MDEPRDGAGRCCSACLAFAGCAANNDRPDDSKFGGFYGGVNGGAVP